MPPRGETFLNHTSNSVSFDHIGLEEEPAWIRCKDWRRPTRWGRLRRWPCTEFCGMVLRAAWTALGVRRAVPANKSLNDRLFR